MPARTLNQIFSGSTDQANFLFPDVDVNSTSLIIEVSSPTATARNWSRAGNFFEISTVGGIAGIRIFRSRLYFGRELIQFIPMGFPYRVMYAPRDYVIDSMITIWEAPISPNPVTRNIADTMLVTRLVSQDFTRKGVTITNFSEYSLVLGTLGVIIEPQGYYESPFNYQGVIDGAWVNDGNGFAQIQEYY